VQYTSFDISYESDTSNGASVMYYIDIYLYNVNVGQCLI